MWLKIAWAKDENMAREMLEIPAKGHYFKGSLSKKLLLGIGEL